MGTKKNHLNETDLLNTQNICLKLLVRKYLQFYAEFFVNLNLCNTTPGLTVNQKFVQWFLPLTLNLIEMPFNVFTKGADPDQAALVRAA